METAASSARKSTLKLCVLGMGIALYVVFALCLQVPVFENYYLCLGYIVMAVFCYSFGPLAGAAVGTLGCILHCLLINGLRGMPGWALGNLFLGVVLGFVFSRTKQLSSTFLKALLNAAAILVSTAIAMLVLKSFVERLLYLQPMALRIAKNLYAFVADAAVLFISLPICMALDGTIQKRFPMLMR